MGEDLNSIPRGSAGKKIKGPKKKNSRCMCLLCKQMVMGSNSSITRVQTRKMSVLLFEPGSSAPSIPCAASDFQLPPQSSV